ncbi:hypothetical protein AURANDRAFT_66812 [Aureococcus anophagefferens]|uniref:Chromo domain-containing protein n=1 Tax=Aureococcus anophagefferens TaxID=44056 RepID=F0YIW5_AURAN|nr:hypothetical protein AURANDRAFT_66812 [Aureococcus anophagefferens]EGB04964.1 hypothetical protein AURANDRAFT_66812 [Aureococcus anophagefferens]|eukprot:XP_009040318.1 hypothetical protein AURANDRAFT_66812 [Aureococcus anophagefferens]
MTSPFATFSAATVALGAVLELVVGALEVGAVEREVHGLLLRRGALSGLDVDVARVLRAEAAVGGERGHVRRVAGVRGVAGGAGAKVDAVKVAVAARAAAGTRGHDAVVACVELVERRGDSDVGRRRPSGPVAAAARQSVRESRRSESVQDAPDVLGPSRHRRSAARRAADDWQPQPAAKRSVSRAVRRSRSRAAFEAIALRRRTRSTARAWRPGSPTLMSNVLMASRPSLGDPSFGFTHCLQLHVTMGTSPDASSAGVVMAPFVPRRRGAPGGSPVSAAAPNTIMGFDDEQRPPSAPGSSKPVQNPVPRSPERDSPAKKKHAKEVVAALEEHARAAAEEQARRAAAEEQARAAATEKARRAAADAARRRFEECRRGLKPLKGFDDPFSTGFLSFGFFARREGGDFDYYPDLAAFKKAFKDDFHWRPSETPRNVAWQLRGMPSPLDLCKVYASLWPADPPASAVAAAVKNLRPARAKRAAPAVASKAKGDLRGRRVGSHLLGRIVKVLRPSPREGHCLVVGVVSAVAGAVSKHSGDVVPQGHFEVEFDFDDAYAGFVDLSPRFIEAAKPSYDVQETVDAWDFFWDFSDEATDAVEREPPAPVPEESGAASTAAGAGVETATPFGFYDPAQVDPSFRAAAVDYGGEDFREAVTPLALKLGESAEGLAALAYALAEANVAVLGPGSSYAVDGGGPPDMAMLPARHLRDVRDGGCLEAAFRALDAGARAALSGGDEAAKHGALAAVAGAWADAGLYAPPAVWFDDGVDPAVAAELGTVAAELGATLANSQAEATHVVRHDAAIDGVPDVDGAPDVDNASMDFSDHGMDVDRADPQYFTTLVVDARRRLALVHWWYLPDSKDEWIPLERVAVHMYHPDLPPRQMDLYAKGLDLRVACGEDARVFFAQCTWKALHALLRYVYNVNINVLQISRPLMIDALCAAGMCAVDPRKHGAQITQVNTKKFQKQSMIVMLQTMNVARSQRAAERLAGSPSKMRGIGGRAPARTVGASYNVLSRKKAHHLFKRQFRPSADEMPSAKYTPEVVEWYTYTPYWPHDKFDSKLDCYCCARLYQDTGGMVFCEHAHVPLASLVAVRDNGACHVCNVVWIATFDDLAERYDLDLPQKRYVARALAQHWA